MKPKQILAAALLPLALLAVGCGDDESATTTDEGTEAGAEDSGTTEEPTGEEAAAEVPVPMGPGVDLEKSEQYNIAEIASGLSQTQTVTRLVLQAGLLPVLTGEGPLTVFAPVNEAFEAIPQSDLAALSADTAQLTEVLTLHVVPGVYTSEDLAELDGQSLTTAQGGQLLVEVNGDEITVGGAPVAIADITASNGVVHAIGAVITAPNA